jgi:hypothetical protein
MVAMRPLLLHFSVNGYYVTSTDAILFSGVHGTPVLLPVTGGQANCAILFYVYVGHVICTVAILRLPWQSNF